MPHKDKNKKKQQSETKFSGVVTSNMRASQEGHWQEFTYIGHHGISWIETQKVGFPRESKWPSYILQFAVHKTTGNVDYFVTMKMKVTWQDQRIKYMQKWMLALHAFQKCKVVLFVHKLKRVGRISPIKFFSDSTFNLYIDCRLPKMLHHRVLHLGPLC